MIFEINQNWYVKVTFGSGTPKDSFIEHIERSAKYSFAVCLDSQELGVISPETDISIERSKPQYYTINDNKYLQLKPRQYLVAESELFRDTKIGLSLKTFEVFIHLDNFWVMDLDSNPNGVAIGPLSKEALITTTGSLAKKSKHFIVYSDKAIAPVAYLESRKFNFPRNLKSFIKKHEQALHKK